VKQETPGTATGEVDGVVDPEYRTRLQDALGKFRFDPGVMQRALGKPYTGLNLDVLLDTTRTLAALSRGESVELTDRDAMPNQMVLGPEDLFEERIRLDAGGLRRKYLWNATLRGNLGGLPSLPLQQQLDEVITSSGLAQPAEFINPLEVLDKMTRVTRLGQGGIGSLSAVPSEARSVQPTHFALIDPTRTPECFDSQTEVMTRDGWKRWPDVTEDDEFACLVDGKLEFHRPERIIRQRYRGTMYGADTGRVSYLVTPNHRLWVAPLHNGARFRFETAEQVHGKNRKVMSGGFQPCDGDAVEYVELTAIPKDSPTTRVIDRVSAAPWYELVGWVVGEGTVHHRTRGHQYRVRISQSWEKNSENCQRISRTLRELGIPHTYAGRAFHISRKQLTTIFEKVGYSPERSLPDEMLRGPLEARRRLFQSLMLGEGRKDRRGDRTQFCTTSPTLAEQVHLLAFGLGVASRVVFEKDDRPQSTTGGLYVVHMHKQNAHQVLHRSRTNHYYTVDYDGMVYCATVPGGLLYVRRGDTVGHWSGNSERAGVDVYFASNTRKGPDRQVYTRLVDARTGQPVWKSASDLADATVAFPEMLKWRTKRVPALKGGKIRFVPRDEVDFVLPHFEKAFSTLNNLVPAKSALKGQRAAMASRMLSQALPLKNPEAPLVQVAVPDEDDVSYEEKLGERLGAIRAKAAGRVIAVTPDEIKVKQADGTTQTYELYHHYGLARKTGFHNTPLVSVGDTVQPGTLLARSNYTDDQGRVALGVNARVAYVPYLGTNFEDANVVSESFARKLTSEHYYKHSLDLDPKEYKLGKNAFVSLFPSRYDKETLSKLDEDGVVKPGTRLKEGDPIILAARPRHDSASKVHKKGAPAFHDASVTWDHHDEAEVVDVIKTKKGPFVLTRAYSPLREADKLSGRYGDKGVTAKIVPDRDMPRDKDGRPFDLLLNPHGMISRVNPAQYVEALLGKVAEKTGKPYKIRDFEDIEDLREFAEAEARKHGVSDLEDIYDPVLGRKIPGVMTGVRWMMKLFHTAESKGQGRGTGGYTAEGTPTKGGEHGSKRVALLNVNALLSHGAYHVLRDAGVVRGQRNEPYWLAFMAGYNPPPPKVPLVYEKFLATLRASGINPVREGRRTQFMALTNKDIDELAGDRYLENAETVMLDDDLTPVKGGLFDPRLTGSHNSTRWARIKLHEPMLNPVMEEPARRVLGLTGKQLENIIAGREQLHGRTGMEAIAKALDAIDLPKEIALARQQIRSGTKTAKDAARRRLSYLKAAEDLKIHPREWVLDSVPVLPPVFRPISMMTGPRKAPIVADANLLYKELWDANENLKAMKEVVGDEVGDERLALYNAFKAVTGLGDPLNPKLQEKRVKGLLAGVFGSSPKHGVVQYKLIGSAVDHVGRGVILPNPDFDMDTLGLPEDRAWDVYKTYVIRRLRRAGMAGMDALREVEAKTPRARKALEEEMQVRPVIMDRAPVLHKFGVLAFRPKLVKGSAVQLPPLVYKGFSCVGRVPIRQGGQFRIVDLADFPHGAPVPDEPGAYEVPEDVEVLTHCSSGGFSWQHPDRYYIHPQLQGVRVTFGRNRQVTVSESHSLYCFDPEQGKCRRMTPAEALGKLSPRVVAAECGSQELGSITGPDGQPLPLTADLGWWLGVVIGDGWPSFCKGQAKGVCLAGAADSSVLRAWSELSHALFGKGPGKPHDRDEDNPEGWGACRRLTISSAELARWLEPLTGRGSRHKHLPDFIWSAPEEFQLGLLAGLLDTDGHCGEGYRGRSNITITTKSRLLAEQLVWLLAQLGVDSACNLRTNNHGRQAWVVNPSVVAFGQLDLPMRMPSKLAELQRLREAPRNSRFVPDLVPISVQEAEELLTHFRGTAATAKGRRRDPKAFTEYSALCKSRQSGGLGRGTLAKIITRLGKDKIPAGLLARWESDERWERVTKLEPAGVMDMYDLRVPGTYTFVLVNKVTVFDSADNDGDAVQYHVPADPEAVQEAYERMLPSKSLISPADMKTPMHAPTQEYIAGLYAASAFVNKKSSPKVFRNEEDVARAYARGEISADDRVEILQAD